ncbi:MAG: DUF1109 domain-containing protein [Sphingopyxis sp.]|jgi:hypothetical protein|nr:DUF1109 domain-containing protein [Sphingopyxis sp.]
MMTNPYANRFGYEPLFDSLVDDLQPVRPMRRWHGAVVITALLLLLSLAVSVLLGVRADLSMLRPSSLFLLRSAMLLLVGVATASAVTAAIRPGVGQRQQGWGWALIAAAMIPLASLVLILQHGLPVAEIFANSAVWCLGVSLAGAALIAAALVSWLRRGAVTQPRRTGMLVGISAGAFGTLAYNLYCPSNSIHYAAIWYGLVLVISAIAGRVVLPRFLRW